MRVLREYIRSTLSTHILIPHPPSTDVRKLELFKVSDRRLHPKTPIELKEDLDSDMEKLFNIIVTSAGHDCHMSFIKSLKREIEPAILFHKEFFNSPRPHQLAKIYGIDFDFDDLESARTPSYPSGHTTQAFFVASKLAQKYPDLSTELYSLAQMIADSRIDAGVHFFSDNEAGKLLAKKLLAMSRT